MSTELNHIQQLKRLRTIQPDPEFIRNSRAVVLAIRPQTIEKRWSVLLWFGATAMAIIMIGFITTFSIFSVKPVLSASLDAQNINNEFDGLNINIELKEVKYQQSANQTITSAISEISDTSTRHLNNNVLEGEKSQASTDGNPLNTDIDKLLDQVIQ
jgi:hypothetical protein